MAIIKRGDDQPVISYYGDDGEEQKCPHCGRPMVIIAMDKDDNKLVCEHCDEEIE